MMYMRAHGNDVAPDQRPSLSGSIAAIVGSLAAGWLLLETGAIASQANAMGMAKGPMLFLQAVLWIVGGALFGRVFNRAAADKRGGWIFGLSFGYVLWTIGPATTMEWIAGKPVAVGTAAMGLLGAYMLFGLVLGAVYPWTSRLFRPSVSIPDGKRFSAAKKVPNPAHPDPGRFDQVS